MNMCNLRATTILSIALFVGELGTVTTAFATQGRLRGVIYDWNNERIACAIIELSNGQSAQANQWGEFLISSIDYGTYDLTVRAGGYAPKIVPILVNQYDNFLTVGQVEPISRITGRVTKNGTIPIEGVSVDATDGCGRSWGGSTDSSGYYSIFLPAGTYTVTAEDTAFRQYTQRTGVQVPVGSTVSGVDLRLLGGAIVGQVVLWDGSPVGAATVLVSEGSTAVNLISAGPGGQFEIEGLPPGVYTLVARDATEKAVAVVDVTMSDQLVQVQMLPGRIIGTIRDHTQTPISGMTIWAVGEYWAYEGTTDTQGRYQIDVAEGRYALFFVPTAADQVATKIEGLSIMAGQQVTKDVALLGPAGSVSGYVRDTSGGPISGAVVIALGGSQSQAPVYTTTESDGSFILQYLSSGSYSVRASADGYEPSTQDAIAVQLGQTTQGVILILQAGSGSPSSPCVSGFVRTAGGQGINGVLLTFSGGIGPTSTDNNGSYSLVVPNGWSGTVTPSKTGYAFTPESRSYMNVTTSLVDQNFTGTLRSPLQEALDTSLDISTTGDSSWFDQATVSYWGGDAAQSGDVDDDQSTAINAMVTGPGTVSFYWKVSSERGWDFLEFNIDGAIKDRISGEVDWQTKSYTITGTSGHNLQWRYVKDNSVSAGSDCGWVDYLQWTPLP